MRIYVVKEKQTVDEAEFLVRANTKGGALRHVAEKTMVAEVATQDDLVRLIGAGAKVEDAGQEQPEAQEQANQKEAAPEPARKEAAKEPEPTDAPTPRKKVWA